MPECLPHAVFSLIESKAHITDIDHCMECGACAMNCPVSAISVRKGVSCAYAVLMSILSGNNNEMALLRRSRLLRLS